MAFLNLIGKFFKILRDGPSPGQIAGGFVAGYVPRDDAIC